jgi:chromosome partitioning protein
MAVCIKRAKGVNGMAIVISVANNKGGIGKTTTAQALYEDLKARGFRVLGIDLDSQGNFSQATRHNRNAHTVRDFLLGGVEAKEAVEGDFIASNAESAILANKISATSLRDAIKPIQKDYDYIIIDTPPSLNIVTIAGLVASGYVVITTSADIFALSGIKQLEEVISASKAINRRLKVAGILFTKYRGSGQLDTQILEAFRASTDMPIFDAKIRESVAVRKAQAGQLALYGYAKASNAVKDYKAFTSELLATIAKEEGGK